MALTAVVGDDGRVYVDDGGPVMRRYIRQDEADHRYEELRGWVTEALNLPGAPTGEARQALLNALVGVTRRVS